MISSNRVPDGFSLVQGIFPTDICIEELRQDQTESPITAARSPFGSPPAKAHDPANMTPTADENT